MDWLSRYCASWRRMVSSDSSSFSRSACDSQVMPSLMACSMPAAASSSRLRVPCVLGEAQFGLLVGQIAEVSLSSPSFWRTWLIVVLVEAPAAAGDLLEIRGGERRGWPRNSWLSSLDGCATKSVAANCMDTSAILNSRLASESTDAASTLSKALVTSFCPVVNEMPLARNPTTGMSAMPTMRVRTETDAMALTSEWIMIVSRFGSASWTPSRRLDVVEELPDLCVEAFGLGGEGVGERLDVWRRWRGRRRRRRRPGSWPRRRRAPRWRRG